VDQNSYTDFVDKIIATIPEKRIFTDFLRRLAYGTDGGFYRLTPQVVVCVLDEDEMITCLRAAHKRNLPVTFKAAGTSLSGQAVSDSILLMASEGWESYEVLEKGNKIRLQPGIIGAKVNRILQSYGRKFGPDPASVNSAMVGGIVINNASGMNCGTHDNAYQTIESARIIFADGTLLDTGDSESRNVFCKQWPLFVKKIIEIRDSICADDEFSSRIRKKYSIKNTTGFSINPFIDFDDPFDILLHLMVGSEGALGFLSEVVMRTVASHPCKASSMVYFPDIVTACEAVVALKKQPVYGAELLDRLALKSVENKDGIPKFIKDFDKNITAVLIETQAEDAKTLQQNISRICATLQEFSTIRNVEFTSDPEEYKKLWDIRKGVFPAVGGMREIGTTCLIEDVAYHLETLPAATEELQQILCRHGYKDAVIYGHALEGNFHFIINQNFSNPKEVERYDALMNDVINMTVDTYDGSLKAEHGTGRNMAPFVRKEWGEKAYTLMKDVKKLFDPSAILNPGVIINEDPTCHLQNFKSLAQCDPLVDKCIECGFCEVKCMSNQFSLTARQRIVVQREIARLRSNNENPEQLAELENDFIWQGVETCAGDGLCATSCPVGVDTGKYIKQLRGQFAGSRAIKTASWVAGHMSGVTSAVSLSLTAVNGIHSLIGTENLTKISTGIRSLSKEKVPHWTPAMPKGAKSPPKIQVSPQSDLNVVYFPSCIARSMGPAKGDPVQDSISDVTVKVLEKAGYGVIFPEGMKGLCCGTPWESKGFTEIADVKSTELEVALLAASENGNYPIFCDTSPCLYRMRKKMGATLKLYEPAQFVYTYLFDKLLFQKQKKLVAIHSTCSTRKLGLTELLRQVAEKCATEVLLPDDINCCGFAGDKGFIIPNLNKHGLRKSVAQVKDAGVVAGYSNSRTCEVGCATYTGIPYMSIMYLVDEATKPLPQSEKL